MSLAEDIINIRKDRQSIFIVEIIYALTIEGRYAYHPEGTHSIEECGRIIEDIHTVSGRLMMLIAKDWVFDDLAAKMLASITEKLSENARKRLYDRFALTGGA